ncbi:DNA polymerase Y family protein [Alteromonas ponticola]|uniref:DNA polymerase Y family protein n=1 Tax=Alteromonas aquimaris TaxID=2998417 RepID=A0ABT3PCV8_9ALTE|nr:DNA polymerase Y family protein [Alteromonas aquimaris]MCW8109966.1 DNA polymerase Y family protein [Alteromonas aquimaris]
MLWLFLDFHQLSLDALAPILDKEEPRPCVIYEAEVNQIVQCNSYATEAGIEVGMGMAQAASLCSDLSIIDYKVDRETSHLKILANSLYQLIGDIVLIPPASLALRLDPSIRFYDGLRPLCQTIMNELNQQKVNFHFATGWSIESAKVLAKAKMDRILSDQAAIHNALLQCHLNQTDLTTQQVDSLARVGIHTLQSLLSLPTTEIGKRFDNKLISYLTALRGEVFPTCVYFHPEEKFAETIEPAYEISQTQHLLPWVNRLLNQLAVFLRLRNQVTASLTLTLFFREKEKESLQIGSAYPLSLAANWLPLFELHIEKLTLTEPVTALGLTANQTEQMNGHNSDFFYHRFHYFAKMQLLGKLQAKLGSDNVCTPTFNNDHRLEEASPAANFPAFIPHWHPLFIATTPLPLSESSQIQFGPVRIQTGWWDDQDVKRDYFIAQTSKGELLLVYKSSPEQQWFIQGWYG